MDDLIYRAAVISTVDADARTVEAVWATETPVRRSVRGGVPFVERLKGAREYDEVLQLEGADLSRLSSGAPVLDSHDASSLQRVLGVVDRVWVEGTEGRATLRFSARDDVEPYWRDIREGILRHVSVGYTISAVDVEQRDNSVPLVRVTNWVPLEISMVPIGADPAAGLRGRLSEEMSMPENDVAPPAAETSGGSEPVVAVDRDQVVCAERERVAGILEAARKLRVEGGVVDDLIQRGVDLAEARRALINAAAERSEAVLIRSVVNVVRDERETRRAAVEAALLHRVGTLPDLPEMAREWRGYSLRELPRALLAAEGERVSGMSLDTVVSRAFHTTSDFSNILANVQNKTLRQAYEQAPRTYLPVVRRVTVADFKPVRRVQLGEAPQLQLVNEAGEFTYGSIGEAAETYQIKTYGRIISITRQTIINDDLDAFTRIPRLFGSAAAALESDTVWSIITTNAAMADGVALFHANHKNLAGTAAAISVTSVGAARAAMAKQTGIDGVTLLNVRPSYLVVPTDLQLVAEQLISQTLVPAQSSNVVPASISGLQVIAEPRLNPTSGAAPWYLFASPAEIDTLEIAYLDGREGLVVESDVGFEVDGVRIKARLDFGAKAIDWRGMFKNAGA